MSSAIFVTTHAAEIGSLISKITDEAMVKLPCLSLGTKEQIGAEIFGLVSECFTKFASIEHWHRPFSHSNGRFTVTLRGVDARIEIAISLCLGDVLVDL